LPTILSLLLMGACVALLATVVIARRGNLGWDDADYLRRGLADARLSASPNPLLLIPRALDRFLQERPKPPFLVAWIAAGALLAGRSNLDGLMVFASVVPFTLVMASVVLVARRLHGRGAGLLALILLIASPRALSFGARVMVETFLSLWLLLAVWLSSLLLARPSRKLGVVLGLVAGLAALTKLTTVLFLPGILLPFLPGALASGPQRSTRVRALGWACFTCAAVAGPWYVRNLGDTLEFAFFSARCNVISGDLVAFIPVSHRLACILNDLPGPILLATLTISGLCAAFRSQRPTVRMPGGELPPSVFERLSVSSLILAVTILMIPPYFDSRFLLPIWPAAAVVLSGRLTVSRPAWTPAGKAVRAAGLAVSVAFSVLFLVNEPVANTSWRAQALIDSLVSRYAIASLANVGNTAHWNVCKTGLINELRERPGDCFVLHDLSSETPEGLKARLRRFDAVVVLDRTALAGLDRSPGLNRAYGGLEDAIHANGQFKRVDEHPREGLPPLSVYVRFEDRGAEENAGVASHDQTGDPTRR